MIYKRFSLIMVFLMLTVMLFTAGSASAENLLVNADFSAVDEDGIPEHWYTDAYYPQTGYSVFSTGKNGQEGGNTVSIRNINENDARFAQTVAVEPDSLYMLSGYISAEEISGGHGANLSIEGIYAFSEQIYDTDGEWQYIEYYGETGPEQHYITVFARLGGYSGMCTGSAAFSGLALEKVDSIPDDAIADMWYRETDDTDDYADDAEYEEEEEETSIPAVFWLILIGLVYLLVCLVILNRQHHRPELISDYKTVSSLKIAGLLAAALLLRMIISWFVEGYLVDVGCFLSWGQTMFKYGPAEFYVKSGFCRYFGSSERGHRMDEGYLPLCSLTV